MPRKGFSCIDGSNPHRDETRQLLDTRTSDTLTACIALDMLEQATEETKLMTTIWAFVFIELVPSIGGMLILVALVGKTIEFLAVSAAFAGSRFEVDHHS
jgi:hypothetical protein